jgi:hypothetical protein
MSNNDEHPAIRNVADSDGVVPGAHIDHAGFCTYQALKFVVTPPAERAKALRDIEQVVGLDDGTSLRSKSQLVDLHKKLSVTHRAMIKAGR